jgi:glycerol uptake facilitator-like aquaporin
MLGEGGLDNLWVYLIAPSLGGLLAAVVYKVQNPEEPAS